jgi:hypothetical protein
MDDRLSAVVAEFEEASGRLRRLVEEVPEATWGERPEVGRWSISEHVAHLNLTARAFLPELRQALGRARELGGGAGTLRRDPMGWLLWRLMGPPVRLRVKTSAAFVPEAGQPRAALVQEFEALQAEQIEITREADGLPIGRVRIRSPFDARASYNVYAALTMLPRHEHRHLWHAERAAETLGARGA